MSDYREFDPDYFSIGGEVPRIEERAQELDFSRYLTGALAKVGKKTFEEEIPELTKTGRKKRRKRTRAQLEQLRLRRDLNGVRE